MLEEGDQGGSRGDDLRRRDIHIVDLERILDRELAAHARLDPLVDKAPFLVQHFARLGDGQLLLVIGGHEIDLFSRGAVDNLAVGRFDKAELVDAGVGGQRGDQTDVRPFRGFDGAETAVVGIMDVAHLKAGAFAGQTARAEGREPALVGQLRERVGLVHELRELAGAEKGIDD